jgi:hypothetical protein
MRIHRCLLTGWALESTGSLRRMWDVAVFEWDGIPAVFTVNPRRCRAWSKRVGSAGSRSCSASSWSSWRVGARSARTRTRRPGRPSPGFSTTGAMGSPSPTPPHGATTDPASRSCDHAAHRSQRPTDGEPVPDNRERDLVRFAPEPPPTRWSGRDLDDGRPSRASPPSRRHGEGGPTGLLRPYRRRRNHQRAHRYPTASSLHGRRLSAGARSCCQ